LEIGTFVIELVPTDRVKITKEAINEQKNEVEKKKINFSYKFEKNTPTINGDPKLLHMIVQNLLSNAIKYTPDKGNIKLSLSVQDSKKLLLTISDTGYGIPTKQQDKIFTKLFRADNARKISSDGTGLGLYIIKSVTEKPGGKIWFEPEENKGTTFYVHIPIKAVIKKGNL
jgi:two-component system sensor histidine kinase VicK